ncbi:hypothetical protein ACWGID_23295 [Kribbella sp. NPDC054772]
MSTDVRRSDVHRAREGQRDLRFANVGTPTPSGSVSEASLTDLAHARAAAGTGPRPSVAQDPMFRAGMPPSPGQSRSTGDAGARPTIGGQTQHRGPGRNSPGTPSQGR